jgi:hypothetical protein
MNCIDPEWNGKTGEASPIEKGLFVADALTQEGTLLAKGPMVL